MASKPMIIKRIVPFDLASNLSRVWIEQKFMGVEAKSVGRVVWAMHAITVELARHKSIDINMPNLLRSLKLDPMQFLLPRRMEKAEFHLFRMRGEKRKINPFSIPNGTQWSGVPITDLEHQNSPALSRS
jgi:hypothetical protein